MPPSILVADVRDKVDGGPVAVGTLDGGQFFSPIGPTVPGGMDPAQTQDRAPKHSVIRFRGQLYFIGTPALNLGSVWVFDEGGTNDWTTGVSAKGGQGLPNFTIATAQFGAYTGLHVVNTGGQDYLVFGTADATNGTFWRYDPDAGANGTWTETNAAAAFANTMSQFGFVSKGTFHLLGKDGNQANTRHTFNPATLATTATPNPTSNARTYPSCFTLEDRLFCVYADGNTSPASQIEEFTLGAWAPVGASHNIGSGAGCNTTVLQLADNSVLLIGPGGPGAVVDNGLVAWHVSLPSPGGVPVLVDVTDDIVPTTLKPAALQPGFAPPTPSLYRVYAFTDNDAVTGAPTHWLMFHPAGVSTATGSTLIQVFDEATPMLIVGAAGADSDFSFPSGGYGSGERYNGIDGTTRLVTPSHRGYSQGPTGIVIHCSAHGDATVLAHGVVTAGPFVAGELLTGAGGATAIVAGDGAAEGLYVREITNGPFVAGEVVTGAGGANAVLDTVIEHDKPAGGGVYQVGEVVTGLTSTAFGTVTHLGIGGAGERLLKMDTITGTFQVGEVLSGGTSGTLSNSTSGPRGFHGGTAVKKIRARFFLGALDAGIGVPVGVAPAGYATLVAGSGVNCTISKGTGPGGSDEAIGIVAEGGVGGDAEVQFEWDFLLDGVPNFKTDQVQLEVDRS